MEIHGLTSFMDSLDGSGVPQSECQVPPKRPECHEDSVPYWYLLYHQPGCLRSLELWFRQHPAHMLRAPPCKDSFPQFQPEWPEKGFWWAWVTGPLLRPGELGVCDWLTSSKHMCPDAGIFLLEERGALALKTFKLKIRGVVSGPPVLINVKWVDSGHCACA